MSFYAHCDYRYCQKVCVWMTVSILLLRRISNNIANTIFGYFLNCLQPYDEATYSNHYLVLLPNSVDLSHRTIVSLKEILVLWYSLNKEL